MGKYALRLDFDRQLMRQFRSFAITADAGLLPYRELAVTYCQRAHRQKRSPRFAASIGITATGWVRGRERRETVPRPRCVGCSATGQQNGLLPLPAGWAASKRSGLAGPTTWRLSLTCSAKGLSMVHQQQPKIAVARYAAEAVCLGITVFAVKTVRIMMREVPLDADKSSTFSGLTPRLSTTGNPGNVG
jgi:hypothetical protein